MTDRTVSVVGGGVSGLAAAYYLRQLLPDVTIALFERSERLGGRIRTERIDGYLVELGPDGFVTHKPAALEFANALGLASQVIHSAEGLGPAYIRSGSRLHRLPDGLSGLVPARLGPLFRCRVLSVPGRLRVALEPWIRPRPTFDESLDQFLTRRFGREAARRLFEPLFGGIYGRTDALSARTTVPQLVEMERVHGSVLRGMRARKRSRTIPQKLTSFMEGMAVLPERARVVLESSGVTIKTHVGVERLSMDGGYVRLVLEGNEEISRSDALIIASPVGVAADLLASVAPAASGILSTIATTSSAVVALGFPDRAVNRALDASGYVVAGDHARPVTACTWSSAKFPRRAPAGRCLFRVFFGGDSYEAASLAESDLIEMALQELRETVGAEGSPDMVRVHQHYAATPHLIVGHMDRVAALETALQAIDPPIALAGNFQSGVGIADAVAAGRDAARRIAERMRRRG